jgi:hypothetical protein
MENKEEIEGNAEEINLVAAVVEDTVAEETKAESVTEEVSATQEVLEESEIAETDTSKEIEVDEATTEIEAEEESKDSVEEDIDNQTDEVTAAPIVAEEFDWDAIEVKGFGEGYSKAQKDELVALYGDSLSQIEEKQVILGTIVSISDRDVILNIGIGIRIQGYTKFENW